MHKKTQNAKDLMEDSKSKYIKTTIEKGVFYVGLNYRPIEIEKPPPLPKKPYDSEAHEKEILEKNIKYPAPEGFKTLELYMDGGLGPHYKVSVYSNGNVEWEGICFVKHMGKKKYHISKRKIRSLSKAIHESCFWHLKKSYSDIDWLSWNDGGLCSVTVENLDGKAKTVTDYFPSTIHAPIQFARLIDKIEKITKIKKYNEFTFDNEECLDFDVSLE